MSDYEYIFDNLSWSFSNLKSFIQCPFEWKLKYVDCCSGIDNIYGKFGSVCHKTLELYLTNKLKAEELLQYYTEHFDVLDVVQDEYEAKRYDKLDAIGKEYFTNFTDNFNIKEIIGVEKKIEFDFFGKTFIGYIDLIYRDKEGNLIILDHKTAEAPFNKNGTIKKTKQSDFDFYKKQLYIYCLGIEKIYGRRPNKIGWNFIRSGQIHLLDFDKQEYKEACEWAKETISNVYCTERFSRVENFFYCNNLCKYRNLCYRLGEEDEY